MKPTGWVNAARRWGRLAGALAGLLGAAGGAPAALAEPPGVLRVGTSRDYAPFSLPGPGDEPAGFDPALARRYAADRGLALEWVPFAWPELVADLESGRFDVAMSGVTVRPERTLAGRFSVPVTHTGAVALVPRASPLAGVTDLDRPEVRLAVNRGGHLERVARAHFPRARIDPRSPNAAVRAALLAGEADAAVTDTLEAPHWRRDAPPLRVLGPFTRDRKAYLVAPERDDLARDLDAWLLAREADGSLAALRAEHGLPAGTDAAPFPALLAAVDERLALMPLVAEAKRAGGAPVEVPGRERLVLASARRGVAEAARRLAAPPPDPAAVDAFFHAQIEAAKALQRTTLAGPAAPGPAPDLDAELRPALLRVGDRIAALLVGLPVLDCATARREAVGSLRTAGVPAATRRALGEAAAGVGGARCGSAVGGEAGGEQAGQHR